jgi:hypothetical protein
MTASTAHSGLLPRYPVKQPNEEEIKNGLRYHPYLKLARKDRFPNLKQ